MRMTRRTILRSSATATERTTSRRPAPVDDVTGDAARGDRKAWLRDIQNLPREPRRQS